MIGEVKITHQKLSEREVKIMTTQQINNTRPRNQLSGASISVRIEKVMTEREYAYYSKLAKLAGFAGLKTYLQEQVDNALAALHPDTKET